MKDLLPEIPALDPVWFQRALERQARLTMPTGALGRVLELGRLLCAIQESIQPVSEPAAIVVMAGDHGVAAEGVSAYPQEITGQMVANFLRGGAAINVLARRVKARVLVVDMGIREPGRLQGFHQHADFLANLAIAPGTANFLHGPAMTRDQAWQAVNAGRQVIADHLADMRVVCLGEMGIGNTTCASAIAAALLNRDAAAVTGRGTALDDAGWKNKVAVVQQALARHFYDQNMVEPLHALTCVGGFEIAGLAGAALEAAARRKVVILDGFISSVAGLVAARLAPAARNYFIASHQSVEAGHRAVLEALDLQPLLDLGLRLGEGSGAALALGLVHAAADILRDMATFDDL